MNFKKLIKEEINDFDWIRNIRPQIMVISLSELSIGDKVILHDDGALPPPIGYEGEIVTVIHISSKYGYFDVAFDEGSKVNAWSCEDYYPNLTNRLCWGCGTPVTKLWV